MNIQIHAHTILLALPEFENFAENLKNQFNIRACYKIT